MKIKFLLFTLLFVWMAVITGCGENVAPSSAKLSVNPTSVTIKDTVDAYTDQYIYTVLTGPSGAPMNGLNVKYEGSFAIGQQANSVGVFAFLDKNGNICQSPCTLTTDSRGVSIMRVRFCTTIACQQAANIPLPSSFTAGQAPTASISYTTNIYVSSGSATPAVVTVSIN